MKSDLKCVVKKIAEFLEKKLTDDEMEKLLKHLSFESMRNNESVNNTRTFNTANKSKSPFIRKGIVGDHKNVMSPLLIKEFDEWIARNNKRILYESDYQNFV